MFDPVVQSVLSMAKDYNRVIARGLENSVDWPWKIVRLVQNFEVLRSSIEQCLVNDVPVAPREILLDRRKVKRWVKSRKPEKPERQRSRRRR